MRGVVIMRKTIIRWLAIVFICVLTVCIIFGQSIRYSNMLEVNFTHAMSGTLKYEYSLPGIFVWRETEDEHTPEEQQYPIICFESPDILPMYVDSLQFDYLSMPYYGAVINQFFENGKQYVEVMPEAIFWENKSAEYVVNQVVYVKYIRYSERYHTIIPNRAIHITENGSFIYLASLEKGYWSADYVVQKRPVTVIDTSNEYSAIAERIMDSDYIILPDDNAQLREGMYVREGKP